MGEAKAESQFRRFVAAYFDPPLSLRFSVKIAVIEECALPTRKQERLLPLSYFPRHVHPPF